jgi:hypothetical protein
MLYSGTTIHGKKKHACFNWILDFSYAPVIP